MLCNNMARLLEWANSTQEFRRLIEEINFVTIFELSYSSLYIVIASYNLQMHYNLKTSWFVFKSVAILFES